MRVTGWQQLNRKLANKKTVQAFGLAPFFHLEMGLFKKYLSVQCHCQVEVLLNRHFFSTALYVKGAAKISLRQPGP